MASTGHGIYTVLSPKLLPPLYLAYNTNAAGDSGKVHSDVKARWHAGDETIRGGVSRALADSSAEALRSGTSTPSTLARTSPGGGHAASPSWARATSR